MMARFVTAVFMLIYLAGTGQAQQGGSPFAEEIMKPFTGDFDQMKKDKIVRILIPYSLTDYYLEDGHEKGLAAEYLREFEKTLNKGIRKEADRIAVVLLPTQRDELISGLVNGHGDIAVANLTITPERLKSVDFSEPYRRDVQEVVVTGKDVPDLASADGLAGMEIHTRRSSSYYESLAALNETFEAAGKEPVEIVEVDEALEDEDLLEMLNAGIIPAVVMDDYKAKVWLPIFENVKMHTEAPVREGADLAWAFRKNSPELEKTVNAFVTKTRIGTMLGNILAKRYSSDIGKVINPKSEAYQKRLDELMGLFEKVGAKYDIDPLLLAAQAFQESRFNHKARSRVGAVGIMQVLPSTARDRNVAVKNFRELEGNIEAGAKYNRFVADQYFSGPEIPELQKILFVLASYNAGPNRVARVRNKADNPNEWFDHVEWQVAAAAGSEPVKYVKNIYIYYLIFSNLTDYDRKRGQLPQ